MTVSLTKECGGKVELILFNRYGGEEFDVTVCVNGEFFETRTFVVPYFPDHRTVFTGIAGYNCPGLWAVRLNPMPPQVCEPWMTWEAFDVWAMSP